MIIGVGYLTATGFLKYGKKQNKTNKNPLKSGPSLVQALPLPIAS